MIKKNWLTGICWCLLGLVIGGLAVGLAARPPRYLPPLRVTGDVARSYVLHDLRESGPIEQITFQGKKYRAVKMADVIKKAAPVAGSGQLYLAGQDGFVAAIAMPGPDTQSYIAFTAEHGWEAINLKHPNSSNVKQLAEIIVVANEGSGDFAFKVINQDGELARVTPGRLLTGALTRYPYPEGKAVLPSGGDDYEAQIFTRRLVFQLGDVAPLQEGEHCLLISEKGECRMLDDSGYFEVKDNQVDYLQPDTRTVLAKVRGVIVNPPAASITDTYYAAQHYLNGGEPLLLVVLDGLTYRQYSHAAANGQAPFLQSCGSAVKAYGVYPPDTNVGLAAILTGKAAAENGIISKEDKQLKTPSIFAAALKLNKQVLILEADQKRLDTEVEPVCVTDQNGDGSADDELCAALQDSLDKDYDLILARFHSIGAAGQGYGEMAWPTLQAIRQVDQYLAEITGKWPGKVIIAGSQGAWPRVDGTAANFSPETMFVPYWRLQ